MRNLILISSLLRWTLGTLCWVLVGATACPDSPQLQLRLKDGSFAYGELVESSLDNHVGWQVPGLAEPFQIDVRAIRSITSVDTATPTTADTPPSGQFELAGGDVIRGELKAWGAESVQVSSPVLGELSFPRSALLSFVDVRGAGEILFSGPITADLWKPSGNAKGWTFEAGSAVSTEAGSILIGNVDLPQVAQVNLAMSWQGVADFVFSFGTLATNRISRAQDVPSACRLEVWDKELALLREVGRNADVTLLSDLSISNSRLELQIFIDQPAGVIRVCDIHGRTLGKVEAIDERPIERTAVHLVNNGPALKLEQFEVRAWDGSAFDANEDDTILLHSGESLPAKFIAFNPASNTVDIETTDGSLRQLDLASIKRADLRPRSGTTGEMPDQNTAPNIVEVILKDASRLRGKWLSTQGDRIQIQSSSFDDEGPLTFAMHELQGVVGSGERFINDLTERRNGTLRLDDELQLSGYLAPNVPAGSGTALSWHLHCSANASPILPDTSGAIIYRRALPAVRNLGSVRSDQGVKGEAIMLQKAPEKSGVSNPGAPSASGEIQFRSGDAIDGRVDSIDVKGMRFSSKQTQTTFAEHAQIQSITINAGNESELPDPKKLERLVTIPRSMKNDPPTHLFVSVTGDYLRGRLISMDNENISVEVRLDIINIPRENVAQIIWLHDRDWGDTTANSSDKGKPTEEQAPFRVHGIGPSERGLTFVPRSMKDGTLRGESPLLGECFFETDSLSQLLFGRDIGQRVRNFREDPWSLSLARLPRAFDVDSSEDSSAQSALIGSEAPDFDLKTVGDAVFRLSAQRERIVVLDFWASWCGPCIQTMPEIEKIVEELGRGRIHLVAVNIQEGPAQVQAAVKRLGLKSTVILDSQGEVASAYGASAIPQTVIVDQQGRVTHVFVGGGNRFLEQFRSALEELLAG